MNGTVLVSRFALTCSNSGASCRRLRTTKPTTTSTIDSRNGMRQPQATNDSSGRPATARKARLDVSTPIGTPNCAKLP